MRESSRAEPRRIGCHSFLCWSCVDSKSKPTPTTLRTQVILSLCTHGLDSSLFRRLFCVSLLSCCCVGGGCSHVFASKYCHLHFKSTDHSVCFSVFVVLCFVLRVNAQPLLFAFKCLPTRLQYHWAFWGPNKWLLAMPSSAKRWRLSSLSPACKSPAIFATWKPRTSPT